MNLLHGDCLELMDLIPDHSIHLILADLPYGSTNCHWDSIIPLHPLWDHYIRIIKPNGAIVLTANQPFTSALIMSNPTLFKYTWTWIKSQPTGHLNAYKMPLKNVEDICVFYSKLPTYNYQLEDKPIENIRKTTTIRLNNSVYHNHQKESVRKIPKDKMLPKQTLYFNSPQNNFHPTEKPIPLFEYLVKTYSNESDTVLDNTMGSGTTAIACANTNRYFIGIEKDPHYFSIAKDRISKHLQLCPDYPFLY